MKTSYCLKLILFTAILSGCSNGFQSQTGQPSADGLTANNPGPIQQDVTSQGQVNITTQTTSDDGLKLETEIKVPYGRVFKALSQATRTMAPYACQWVPGIQNSPTSSYNAGEIPCGQIIDGTWKQLLSVTVDPFYTVDDGFNVYIYGTTLPIYLSRAARTGMYTESDLTTKSAQLSKTSSPTFGEDVSLRYTPNGTNARLELCLNIPGSTLTAPPQVVVANAWKKVLGVKLNYDSTITVTPGQASYDYGRGCVALDFGWQGGNLTPAIQVNTTQNPHLSNVSYTGLNLRVNDWFLRLADRVVSWFRTSIRTQVVNTLSNKVNQIADSDVESGAWFTRIHADDLVQNSATRINARVARVIQRTGMPTSADDVRTLLRDNCRIKRLSGSADWGPRLETVCRDVITNVQVDLKPFAVDANSKSLGCYDHMANIHERQQWWATQCQFAAQFSLTLPAQWKDYVKEVRGLIEMQVSKVRLPEAWSTEISRLNIDPELVSLVLEELEARGYTQIVPDDWAQRIPAIWNEIKQRL